MTNHWVDLKNSDVILVMGGNPAANHPISMKWVMKAKERGAKLICVDPRYTQSAAVSDIYAPLRSGTDIAFLGGLLNHILQNDLIQREYVLNYTDAPFLVDPDFQLPVDADGVFSGHIAETAKYDRATWKFQLDENGVPKRDATLQDPNCVYQLLKKHYARYTLDMASQVTGTPKEKCREIWDLIASTHVPNKAATVCYAMGWTQHTVGVQNIRAFSIIQLLLGNTGMAGGGVNALRGESNVQGSTDYGLLFHIVPGYMPVPRASVDSLDAYINKFTPTTNEPRSVNWWSNRDKYFVSYLKAMYGDSATPENNFGYDMFPKLDDGMQASWLALFAKMYRGAFEGLFCWGMNPAVSSAGAGKVREALGNLKWLVSVDLVDHETSSFWRGPGVDPKYVDTEVFILPAVSSVEKEGSVTNSSRLAQWRYVAIEPRGQSLPDADICNELYWRVKELYRQEGGAYPDPILGLSWDYGKKDENGKIGHVDPHAIAKEINGYYTEDVHDENGTLIGKKGDLVPSFSRLRADGSTNSGNWLYCNSYVQDGDKTVNRLERQGTEDRSGIGLLPDWAWTWPVNRRIIYNRASVDLEGKPWNPDRPVIEWTEDADGKGSWAGDVPDGGAPPMGPDASGKLPFIMKPLGVGAMFGGGLVDGPFPEHYEPMESPVAENLLVPNRRVNPTINVKKLQKIARDPSFLFTSDREDYPIVATTYRLIEHWQTGVLTRRVPWLMEMHPQMFVEMDHELAAQKGIENGEQVQVVSARGSLTCAAVITYRFRPMNVQGETVHMVGMPWHFGWQYPEDGSGGDAANLLTPFVGDPNTLIPESKAFLVDIKKIE